MYWHRAKVCGPAYILPVLSLTAVQFIGQCIGTGPTHRPAGTGQAEAGALPGRRGSSWVAGVGTGVAARQPGWAAWVHLCATAA